ncbi:MAG: acetyl-CoA carboxylase biotin carboxylase subunit [Flavobacteriales bacterium]|nr:acetyl-CoA carboxylase biotin carboxylase subunit [Flavobacteriales bacterium]NNK80049.1 acetyl-CoA carboxylase biotin carboxylase subunit [Flavobacteriales bacterium]
MKKVLVANRGEIALRVIRTLKEMKIIAVAVYSEADRYAPFVIAADEAVCIGPPPSSESYLMMDKIITVAKEKGVEGIHPGYGFLSENAEFAKKVTDSGMAFIGPSPHAIKVMGSKLAAKETVSNYDIPMIPGTDKALDDIDEGLRVAKEIGFPILVKASAGGGGKGMRIVEREEDFKEQLERAISEAKSAFGDGSVFIERFVTQPRHIEIQVLADTHGNVVHLFERECSIQRRHQKVVEEAPSSVLTEELRAKMGAAAVDVARSCQYVGAGTVEFLLDADMNFYFLEMNTRLQVEHPVTELISGVDLVREQINIARGEELSFDQEDLQINGHAIELRVYAEDPENGFLPDIGTLKVYSPPSGPGIRLDDGFREGMEIPVFYDPMISKLCVYAQNREFAMDRMIRAIDEYTIVGIKNTLSFGQFVMKHPAFRSGKFDTGFVKEHFEKRLDDSKDSTDIEEVAVIVAEHLMSKSKNGIAKKPSSQVSNWKSRRTTV